MTDVKENKETTPDSDFDFVHAQAQRDRDETLTPLPQDIQVNNSTPSTPQNPELKKQREEDKEKVDLTSNDGQRSILSSVEDSPQQGTYPPSPLLLPSNYFETILQNYMEKLNERLEGIKTNIETKLDNTQENLEIKLNTTQETIQTNLEIKLNATHEAIQMAHEQTQKQIIEIQSALTNMHKKIRDELTQEFNEKFDQHTKDTTTLKKEINERLTTIEKTMEETKNWFDSKQTKDDKNQKEHTQKDIEKTPTETANMPVPYNNRENTGRAALLKNEKPTFNGSSPETFIRKLENYLKAFNLSDLEIKENFHIFLTGKAAQWWEVTRQEINTWAETKTKIITYWVDKDRLKQKWEQLQFKPHYDVERFILTAWELQNEIKYDRPIEKKINKIITKLPNPLKELIYMKKPQTVEQFLNEAKELRKLYTPEVKKDWQYPQTPKNNKIQFSPPRITYNKVYKNSQYQRQMDSLGYNWDTDGNAYNPEGVCVWENKYDHPKRGKKYVNAIIPASDNQNPPMDDIDLNE